MFFYFNKNAINVSVIYQDDTKTIVQLSSEIKSAYSNFIQRLLPCVNQVLNEFKTTGQPFIIVATLMFGNFEKKSLPKRLEVFEMEYILFHNENSINFEDTGHLILEFHVAKYYNADINLWHAPPIYANDDSAYNSEESL